MEGRLGLSRWLAHTGALAVVAAVSVGQGYAKEAKENPIPPIESLQEIQEPPEIQPILPEEVLPVVELESTTRQELAAIMQQMEYYPTIFEQEDFEDIRMYYSIYRAAGEKWDVDWRLLWIVHCQETRCSRMEETKIVRHVADYDTNGRILLANSLYGAMQRDVKTYPDNVAERAFEGLDTLSKLPTRVKTDAREIAFAAWKISEDSKKSGGSLLETLKKYSAPQHAVARWQLLNLFKEIITPAGHLL